MPSPLPSPTRLNFKPFYHALYLSTGYIYFQGNGPKEFRMVAIYLFHSLV